MELIHLFRKKKLKCRIYYCPFIYPPLFILPNTHFHGKEKYTHERATKIIETEKENIN